MSTENKKSTKWIVIGCIVFIVAIFIAVGPILVTKYMRAKWQDAPKFKTSSLFIEVAGSLQLSQDNRFYLKGDNDFYYILKNLNEDAGDRVGQHCSVFAKMSLPKKGESIDGNGVRLFLDVQKIIFDDSTEFSGVNKAKEIDEEELRKRVLSKIQLRVEVNAKLNKPVLFDVIKGKVSVQNRKDLDGKDVSVTILTDEFGSSYMLYKKGFDLSALKDMELICLGRDMLPLDKMPVVVDEITFELYEVFDYEYNKVL